MLTPFLTLALMAASSGDYPQPKLLVEATDLAHRKAGTSLVFDVRGKNGYKDGHIPDAVWLDAVTWDRAFAHPDPDGWARRIGEAGIDGVKTVVLYAGDDVRNAARIWWILRYWGIADVQILDGGFASWKEAGGEVSKDVAQPVPRHVTITALPDRLATKDYLIKALKDRPPRVIDARSHDEFCGIAETARRNGAIPGAVHLEWKECIDQKTKRFKPATDLRQLLDERKIDVNEPAVTYCQTGGRSAVVAFVLELMGGRQVRNYYKSWSEWGNADDTPVQKAKEREKPGGTP